MFCEHAAQKGLGRLRAVRVLGKDFDMSFGVVADVRQLRQGRQAVRPAADRGGQPRPAPAPVRGGPARPRLSI